MKKETLTVVFALLLVCALVIPGLIIGLSSNKKDKAETTEEVVEDRLNSEQNDSMATITVVDNKTKEDVESLYTQAYSNVESFTYNIYTQIDLMWNRTYTDEQLEQLEKLGGTIDDFKGVTVLGVAGNVIPNLECMTTIKQQNLLVSMESSTVQTFFDFQNKKQYRKAVNLMVNGEQEEGNDWLITDLAAEHMKYSDYFSNIKIDTITEDEEKYYLKGVYDTQTHSNLTWVFYYLTNTYRLNELNAYPVTITMDKKTEQIERIDFDLSAYKEQPLLDDYNIVNFSCYVTFKDINTTNLVLPEELQ